MTVNNVTRALERLPGQFQESTNMREFVRIVLEEIQEINDTLDDILLQKAIQDAVGYQLDIIGEIIGLRRQGVLSDTDYRNLLRLQIKVNTSKGKAATILEAWKILTGSTDSDLKEVFPAGIELFTNAGTPPVEALRVIDKILAITVVAEFIFSNSPAFRFDGPGSGGGYSSTEAPTTGGRYVSKVRM